MDKQILKLRNKMIKEGEKTSSFFQSLPEECWNLEIYSEGAHWKIKDILAHLVGAEDGMTRLIQNVLDGGEGAPEDFDLDAYNERKAREMRDIDPDELIDRFGMNRERTVSLIGNLTEESLDMLGRHPWLGEARIGDILKLMYTHALIHQRDIRKKILDE